LRLVDERGLPHNQPLQVYLYPHFDQREGTPDEVLSPDRQGHYESKKRYENYAFIKVVSGNSAIAQMPVPVFDDRPVTVSVAMNAQKEAMGQLQYEVNELQHGYVDARFVFLTGWNEIGRLITQAKYDDALKQAKASRATLEGDVQRLQPQLEQLKKEPTAGALLAGCE